MANFVSPGVYSIEKDISDYSPSVNPSVVGLVGFASRGPVNTPTLLTTPAQLIRTFGTPDLVTGGQGITGALEILQKTNQVYYVRACVEADASGARNAIPLATHPHAALLVSGMNPNFVYKFGVDVWDIAGTKKGDTSFFYAYRERPNVNAADSIMPNTAFADWEIRDWHTAVAAGVGDAYGTNGDLAYIPSGYDTASGLVYSKYAGATDSTCSKFEVSSYFFSGLDYTGTYLSATPIDVTELTFTGLWLLDDTIGGSNKDLPGGTNPSPVNGSDDITWPDPYTPDRNNRNIWITRPNYEVSLSASPMLSGVGQVSGAPSGVSFAGSGAAGGYQIASLYPGLGYNYSAIPYRTGLQFRGLQAKITNTTNNGNFGLDITSDGATDETYNMNFSKPTSQTSATSLWPEDVLNQGLTDAKSYNVKGNFYTFEPNSIGTYWDGGAGIDASGAPSALPAYVGTNAPSSFGALISGAYKFIAGSGGANRLSQSDSSGFRCVTLQPGTYNLMSGTNGDAGNYAGSLSNSNVVQAIIGNTGDKTGIYALDQEDIPITLAGIPGITEQASQNALITLAETTQNFLAVVSPPVGFRAAQQAIAWTNGKATGRTAAINSSYVSVYWPWVKLFDAYTGSDTWYDPAVFAIGQMCYTDEVADPWFAPAGLSRGRLTKPTDVEVKLGQGDRDALYGPGNIINPITKFTSDGIVIYGQRTGQRASTALDRVNVRRLMIFLRRLVLQSGRRFVFEPNDPVTWGAIRDVIQPALADIQQRRGITAFKVVCDSTTNTPIRVDRSELWCKVLIKPTKAAEVIVFELNLTSQSASV